MPTNRRARPGRRALLGFTSAFAVIAIVGCEIVLDIPADLESTVTIECEDGVCRCACGYVQCSAEPLDCDDRCATPETVGSLGEYLSDPEGGNAPIDPMLAVAEPYVYAINGAQVCRFDRGAGDAASASVKVCESCPLVNESDRVPFVGLGVLDGVLYVAAPAGFCAFDAATMTSIALPAPLEADPGRTVGSFIVDTSARELVWVEEGSPPELVRYAPGEPSSENIALTEATFGTLALASEGGTADVVARTCAIPGACAACAGCGGPGSNDICVHVLTVGDAAPKRSDDICASPQPAIERRGGVLYMAPGTVGGGIVSLKDKTFSSIAGNKSIITDLEVVPRDGGPDIFYTTVSGVVYATVGMKPSGGPIIEAVAGSGSEKAVAAALTLSPSPADRTNWLFFALGTEGTDDAAAFELKRLAVLAPSGSCTKSAD